MKLVNDNRTIYYTSERVKMQGNMLTRDYESENSHLRAELLKMFSMISEQINAVKKTLKIEGDEAIPLAYVNRDDSPSREAPSEGTTAYNRDLKEFSSREGSFMDKTASP